MRRDGDLLLAHLATARRAVLLCAPFIKAPVLERLLSAIDPAVAVEVVTRWRAAEIAAGVSDLEVFDIVFARPGATLSIKDELHAKLYIADDEVLIGSANLTATALGWCDKPNLELLTAAAISNPEVQACRLALAGARLASEEERATLQVLVNQIEAPRLPEGEPVDPALAEPWLPRLGAPERLFMAYLPAVRERLTAESLETADRDLQALDLPAGLSETQFRAAVAERFMAMPVVRQLLAAADQDLTDADAVALIDGFLPTSDLAAPLRWSVVREWLTYFLRDRYEIAPQSFVTRLRPGASR
ncbi:phospholipase D family protein [uncultured Brevundimonas sp.]|uniref:phospholipase D family protein n=1 Tax=uncultured Brevundimonas sp. TaxID=213418 RepID=UPI0025EA1BA8|nr:phospholipase D family protein [uncultured Brevundimonas sp.]